MNVEDLFEEADAENGYHFEMSIVCGACDSQEVFGKFDMGKIRWKCRLCGNEGKINL